jgi:hypothetical protein
MEKRLLGKTGMEVSCLGAGLSEIGHMLTMNDIDQASSVLNGALDGGVNFLDTSTCYGISEELIGRTIAHRRDEYILATKAGHAIAGYDGEDWTYQTVADAVDRSLARMKTDRLDLVQLHSCEIEDLEKGEVIRALQDAKQAGKTRFIGYSGDNEAAEWAVESGLFDTLQTSFNLVDQRARTRLFPQAEAQNMGIIVKRPVANGAWGQEKSPSGYANRYFERYQMMIEEGEIPGAPDHPILLALGFVLAHDLVDTAIAGTKNPRHMEMNIEWVENDLPLQAQTVAELQRRFDELDQTWVQLR